MADVSALTAIAGSAFLASLLGSPHCAGMCGGFVCFYAGQVGERRLAPHAAYHLGRLAAYAALGALAGGIGVGFDRMGHAAGVQRAAAVAAGFVLLVWGGLAFVRAIGVGPARFAPRLRSAGPIAAVLRAVSARPPAARALALGLVSSLLPCGWLYLYVAAAAGTGSPLAGSVLMAAFWLGTVPVLLGLGLAAQRAIAPLRRRLPALSAAALIVVGLLTVTGKFYVGAPAHHAAHGHQVDRGGR